MQLSGDDKRFIINFNNIKVFDKGFKDAIAFANSNQINNDEDGLQLEHHGVQIMKVISIII